MSNDFYSILTRKHHNLVADGVLTSTVAVDDGSYALIAAHGEEFRNMYSPFDAMLVGISFLHWPAEQLPGYTTGTKARDAPVGYHPHANNLIKTFVNQQKQGKMVNLSTFIPAMKEHITLHGNVRWVDYEEILLQHFVSMTPERSIGEKDAMTMLGEHPLNDHDEL
eukprot:m.26907 g.26907  ORF g.26907 m.26907 type:complete len:166 (-) comp8884_c2_seq1:245-742(-)